MPKIDALPYLVADTNDVVAEEWLLGEEGHERPIPGILREWDSLTNLSVSRHVRIDVHGLLARCGLPAAAEIMLVISWLSPGTTLKERGASALLTTASGTMATTLRMSIPAPKLAGGLLLLTRLVLKRPGKNASPLAARMPGSILWEDTYSTKLEGIGARFPMEFADFTDQGFPPGAGWRLYWRHDFNAQLMGSLWLLINSKHERLRNVVSGGSTDPQARAIMETIQFSVARDLIVGALRSEEFLDSDQNFPSGSVGEAVRMLIRRVFGNETTRNLVELYKNEPERFDCQLQDRLHLFYAPAG